MKKLILIIATVIFSAVGVNVFAQGSGTAPEVGSEHNYAVTFTTDNSYSWDVTSDFAGNTSVDGTVVTTAAGSNDANIDVTWVNPVPGTTYFVHVTETDGTTNCTNRKVLAVTPVNNFKLDIISVDLDDADTDNGETFEICPSDITVDGYDAGTNKFTYNYQKDSVFYKVTASGINLENTNWSPQFTIDHDGLTGSVVTAGWAAAIDGIFAMGLKTDGTVNDINITPTETTTGEIWIKVVIDNSTTNEGLSKNDITVDLVEDPDNIADNSDESGEDENGNDVTSTGNDSRTQTIKARPSTTSILTD